MQPHILGAEYEVVRSSGGAVCEYEYKFLFPPVYLFFSEVMVFVEQGLCLRLHPRETANETVEPFYRGMPGQSRLMLPFTSAPVP